MGMCLDKKVSRSIRGKQKRREAVGCMTEDQTALGTMREEDQRPWLHLLLELQGKASERNMLGLRDKLCEALSKLRALLKSSPPLCCVPEP